MAPNLNAYFKKVEKLYANLDNAVGDDKKIEFLDEFSKDYLMLPDLWRIRIEIEMEQISYQKKISKLIKRALFDFYSDTFFSTFKYTFAGHFTEIFEIMEEPFNRTLNWNDVERVTEYCANLNIQAARDILIEYICFPHSKLDDILFYVEMFLCEPMSNKLKRKFQISKILYEKIMDETENIEEWFKLLLSTKNDKFIIQNTECRIAREPGNYQLWKMYIEFLGGKKYKAMLSIIYRYRRLFIDDNSFDLKISSTFEKLASLQYLQSAKFFKLKTFKRLHKIKHGLPCLMYYESPKFRQDFSLPSPIIRYITKTAQSDILQKLYQSCKYFFDKRRQPLCYYLSFWCTRDIDMDYFKNGMNLRSAESDELQNICLTGSLNGFDEMISEIILKLSESRLRYIKFYMGQLSISEYNFLTKSGEIEYIYILFTKITVDGTEESEPITLQNLVNNLPKAKYLHLHVHTINTDETTDEILNLKRKNKFNYFNLLVTKFAFDAKLFAKFIVKNMNPYSTIDLTLKGITQEERFAFVAEVEDELLAANVQDLFEPRIFFMQEN